MRQIALVAADLEPVLDDLRDLLGLEVCYRDPGVGHFGLHNGLFAIGDTFLEVVSPVQDGTTAGRYLERRGGDGGYMVILQVDDLDAERARVQGLGVKEVWHQDNGEAAASHWHPRDVGGAILSFDQMTPPESWAWGGPDWPSFVNTDLADAIVGVDIEAEDPSAMCARWSEVVDRPAVGLTLMLDEGTVTFVPATRRGEGVSAVDIRVNDRDRAGEERVVGGTTFRFV